MTNCPCGTGEQYPDCCGRYHAGRAEPPTAVTLMRARYSAFALGDRDFLLRSWHSSTRPAELNLDPELAWTGLFVTGQDGGGLLEASGTVTFTARHRRGEQVGRLRERSRFVREDGHWLYLGPV